MVGGQARTGTARVWPGAVLALALCACANLGGGEQKVDETAFPTEYKQRIRERLELQVADSRSIRDAYIAQPALKPRGSVSRYIVCVKFDAKDETGQYMGNKEYAAFFYAGDLTQIVDATHDMCEGALYSPFPEIEKH
jgi:hypothetical protein